VPELAVVTQNADELHQAAGTREVFPIHGTFLADRCADPDCPQVPWRDTEPRTTAPDCPTCGGPARLDAVVFGEPLDQALYHLAKRAVKSSDLMVVVGTTGAVVTAGNLPWLATEYSIPCVRIDPGPWEGRPVPWIAELAGPAEEILPALVEVACGA
jgi:NAD-dependent deacetylase